MVGFKFEIDLIKLEFLGTNFLSIISFPKKRASDLTTAFTSLGAYSLGLTLIFFVVLVLEFSFLVDRLRIVDSATFIFRILVKEHHIPIVSSKTLKYRLILSVTLIYHFLLTILIETTIGTNLVGFFCTDLNQFKSD